MCVNHPWPPRSALLVKFFLDEGQVRCILLSKPFIISEMVDHVGVLQLLPEHVHLVEEQYEGGVGQPLEGLNFFEKFNRFL